MKKILNIGIFGGSQGVGKHCVLGCLEKEHRVTVLIRDESKLKDICNNPNLVIIKGDATNYQDVIQTVSNQDLIINSLGGWGNVCSQGTELIVTAMKEKGVKRIITCSSLGVGDSYKNCSFFTKCFINLIIRKPIADKNIQEKLLFESGLDSIIIRPGGLTDSNPLGQFKTENVTGGRIPRKDVADFMIQQISNDEYIGKAISIVSP